MAKKDIQKDRVVAKSVAPRQDTLPTGLPSDYKSHERILAPIPGVITGIFVKPGDRVRPGDALLVIEAMKMKNTLRSGHELTVAAVHVKPGESIKAGKLLVEFERRSK